MKLDDMENKSYSVHSDYSLNGMHEIEEREREKKTPPKTLARYNEVQFGE